VGQQGNTWTWGCVEELEPVVRGWVGRRCGDRSEVDDVVQETLLRAARHRWKLGDAERMRGWAVRIARNVLRDRMRRATQARARQSSELEVEALDEPVHDSGANMLLSLGSFVLDHATALRYLARELETLSELDRRLLCSYYAGHRDGERAALECGFPSEQVKVRLFRARRRLRRALMRRLVFDFGPVARAERAQARIGRREDVVGVGSGRW
jgi:RNA polymerase sigma-70 factor (ECF subfamily)